MSNIDMKYLNTFKKPNSAHWHFYSLKMNTYFEIELGQRITWQKNGIDFSFWALQELFKWFPWLSDNNIVKMGTHKIFTSPLSTTKALCILLLSWEFCIGFWLDVGKKGAQKSIRYYMHFRLETFLGSFLILFSLLFFFSLESIRKKRVVAIWWQPICVTHFVLNYNEDDARPLSTKLGCIVAAYRYRIRMLYFSAYTKFIQKSEM